MAVSGDTGATITRRVANGDTASIGTTTDYAMADMGLHDIGPIDGDLAEMLFGMGDDVADILVGAGPAGGAAELFHGLGSDPIDRAYNGGDVVLDRGGHGVDAAFAGAFDRSGATSGIEALPTAEQFDAGLLFHAAGGNDAAFNTIQFALLQSGLSLTHDDLQAGNLVIP